MSQVTGGPIGTPGDSEPDVFIPEQEALPVGQFPSIIDRQISDLHQATAAEISQVVDNAAQQVGARAAQIKLVITCTHDRSRRPRTQCKITVEVDLEVPPPPA
jgi:hypothetical protein